MADEFKRVDVYLGPYRGNLLTMPTAEADQAIADHWGRDPFSSEPYGTGHDALTEEERAAAMAAATAWAQKQWNPDAPPPPEGESQQRDMLAGDTSGRYQTRQQRK